MSVGRVDDDYVDLLGEELLCALKIVSLRAHRRPDAQTPLIVFRCVGIFPLLFDVLDSDQPLEDAALIDYQQFFDPMLVQQTLRVFQCCADRDRDEFVLGHHFPDRQVLALLEAQIAIGENAHQLRVLRHRHSGNPKALHQCPGVKDPVVGRDRDRVDDHAGFAALDAVHCFGLPLDGHVAVDNAHSPLAGQRDRQLRLGHRVHRGAEERDVDRDAARDARDR